MTKYIVVQGDTLSAIQATAYHVEEIEDIPPRTGYVLEVIGEVREVIVEAQFYDFRTGRTRHLEQFKSAREATT